MMGLMLRSTHERIVLGLATQAMHMAKQRRTEVDGYQKEIERIKGEVRAIRGQLLVAQGECATLRGQLVAARHAAGLPASPTPGEEPHVGRLDDEDQGGGHRDNGDGPSGGGD